MAAEVTAGYRLSPQQKRLWKLHQQGALCVAQCAITLEGSLDLERLKTVTKRILDRHEILRTTFPKLAGMKQAVQAVTDEAEPEWKIWNGSTTNAIWTTAKSTAFDLDNGPLVRCDLFARSHDEHVLFVSLPSLCADNHTLRNLFHELARAYDPGLPEEPGEVVQYLQYSEWQNDLVQEVGPEFSEAYWLKQEFLENQPVTLPGENTATRPTAFTPQSIVLRLANVHDQLKAIAHDSGISEAAILLASWQTLLWRLSHEPGILLSLHCHGRIYEEMNESFGLYSRWLPVLGQPKADLQGHELFKNAEKSIQAAHEWQEYFAAEANEKALQIGFSYEDYAAPISHNSLRFTLAELHTCTEPLKLWLSAMPAEQNALRLEFGYDPNVYSTQHIERLAEEFETLLRDLLSHPETRLDMLPVLGRRERRQIISEWNETERDYSTAQPLHRLFELQVKQTPAATAVIFNDESLTFRELNRRANQLAALLRSYGVGPESLVALYMDRSLEMIVGVLGVWKAGGAFVPMDSALPPQRLALLLSDAKPMAVVTQPHLVTALPEVERLVCLDSQWKALADQDEGNRADEVSPDNAAYVIYTSGSTGAPKGVLVQHRSAFNLLRALEETVYAQHPGPLRVSMNAPLVFDASIKQLIQLLRGCALCIIPEEVRRDGPELLAYASQHSLDVLDCTPSQLRMLLAAKQAAHGPLEPALLLVGGEPLDEAAWKEVTDTACWNLYGPTECTVDATACLVRESPESPTIGRPLGNVKVYILDQALEPVPIGVAGELYIGGAGLARCYLNRPGLTATQFIPDSFSDQPGARLYKTGDRVRYREDGKLEFIDRVDFQVKVRGVRIELGEIESVVAQHPAVRETVVLARADDAEQKRLVCYVVSKVKAPALSVAELRSYLKERLPEYMLPAAYVVMDRLPLNANGKLDRRSLPAPGHERPELNATFVAPQTEAEKILAGIWKRVLKVKEVGVNDNFFDLGGDSILSIQVTAQAARENLRISPRLLFQHQNIAKLAHAAESITIAAPDQSEVRGPVPLTPIQQRFLSSEGSEPQRYNQAVLLSLPNSSDTDLQQRVFDRLLRHHDALRMRFERSSDGSWRQYNAGSDEAGSHEIEVYDLNGLSRVEQDSKLAEVSEKLQSGLDLAHGPLIRVAHFALGEERGARLLVVVHHLVIDGVSWRILLEDWQSMYADIDAELPAKTTSYQRWGELQEAGVRELDGEIQHWTRIGSTGAARALPVDHSGGANIEGVAETFVEELNEAESQELLGPVCRTLRAQTQEVVLAAVGKVLCAWAGHDRIVICVEGHGREHEWAADADLTRTVGWFTTLYPVETGGSRSMVELVKQTKEALRATPGQGLGYGMLRELSADTDVRERLKRAGEAAVLFNFLGQVDEELGGEWRLAREEIAPGTGRRRERAWEVEVVARVHNRKLVIGWRYSRERLPKEHMKQVSAAVVDALRELIGSRDSSAMSVSPSDFPLARGLDQSKLEKVISKLQKAEKRQS